MLSRPVNQANFPPPAAIEMTNSSQNQPVVREAGVADAGRLSSLARDLLLHERGLNAGMGELTQWAATPDELRKQMSRPNTRFFVAESPGSPEPEILGYIKIVIHGLEPAREETGAARWFIYRCEQSARRIFNFIFRRPRPNVKTVGGYIAGIYIRPEDRRRGLGRLLVAAAESWFSSRGIKTCELHVLHANEAARRFWEGTGYKPLTTGMRKQLGKPEIDD
jgi:ribosomal protein S18 acetylase RimI-like enzyme